MLLTFHCVDMLRQHVPQDVRMHGIILMGGDKVNVVPERLSAWAAAKSRTNDS